MSMRNRAIPMSTREYPEYVYREFPKVIGTIGEGDGSVTLIARDKDEEARIRRDNPGLPPFVPPPSSLTMAEMKENMNELARLREENRRLRLQVGGVEALPPEALEPKPSKPAPVPEPEVDRGPPGTDPARLAAGEDPNGDPWAKLPENEIPEPGKPPSIKGNPAPVQNNKLKR